MAWLLRISRDSDAEDPRSWHNLGRMICWHRRYKLGDRHEFAAPEDLWDWLESEDDLRQAVVLPVYLYDHSGLRMSVRPFGDPWDSAQVGWIVAPASRIREEYRVKRIGPRIRREVEDVLRGEVEVYDLWLRGEVYGYQLYRCLRRKVELVDSCWGFYGYRPEDSAMLQHLPRSVAWALVKEVSCFQDGLVLAVDRRGAQVLNDRDLADFKEAVL